MDAGIARAVRRIVVEEFKKVQFPFPHLITVEPCFSGMFPEDTTPPSSYGIEFLLNPNKTPPKIYDGEMPRFSFTYEPKTKRLCDGIIELRALVNEQRVKGLEGQGYGRKLVEMRERIGTRLGCTEIVLALNETSPLAFWEHMGYSNGRKQLTNQART